MSAKDEASPPLPTPQRPVAEAVKALDSVFSKLKMGAKHLEGLMSTPPQKKKKIAKNNKPQSWSEHQQQESSLKRQSKQQQRQRQPQQQQHAPGTRPRKASELQPAL